MKPNGIAQIRILTPDGVMLPLGLQVEIRNTDGDKIAIWTSLLSAGELVVQLGEQPKTGAGPMFPRVERRTHPERVTKKPGPAPDPALTARNSHALARYVAGDALVDIAKEAKCSPSGIFEAIQRLARREGISFTPRSQKGPR